MLVVDRTTSLLAKARVGFGMVKVEFVVAKEVELTHHEAEFPGEKVLVQCSLITRWANSCAARASFLALSKMVRQLSNAGRKVFPMGG